MCGNLFDVVPTCVVALVGFAFGFKGTSLVAQMVKRLPTMRETRVQSLGWEGLLEKEMATHSSILPAKSQGRRSLVGYSPWGRKESDMTERLHFHFHFEHSLALPFFGIGMKTDLFQSCGHC